MSKNIEKYLAAITQGRNYDRCIKQREIEQLRMNIKERNGEKRKGKEEREGMKDRN